MADDARDLYQDVILRHSRAPENQRRLENFDASARGDNPMCGDRCEVRVVFGPGGTIGDIGFEARGCAISVASADLMANAVRGRSFAEATRLHDQVGVLVRQGEMPDVPETLLPLAGVCGYPSRIRCAVLPWAALLAALGGGKEASSE
jgi:nitrogen fixation NifU-like protein